MKFFLRALNLLATFVVAGNILAGPASPTTDWPIFRGNAGLTGIAQGTIGTNLSLLWSFKTGGPIKSSAIIADKQAFIGSDDGLVYALDLATGKTNWTFKTGGPIEAAPMYADGRIFIGSSDAHLYSIDAKTGQQAWKYETGDKILGSANSIRSPDGKTNWIIVGSYDYKLHCVEATSGKPVWNFESGNYINGAPAVSDGKSVFGGCDALLHVIGLSDGKKLKEIDAGAYIAGSGALIGNEMFIGHYENEFLCADLEAGTIKWRYRDRAFAYFSSPAVTKDRVIFGGRDKRLHCLERATGKALWTFATKGKVDSSPVVVGDRIVVGSDDGRLYMVSLVDGKEIWSYEVGEAVTSSPAISNGRVVIGAQDGSVYCFGAK